MNVLLRLVIAGAVFVAGGAAQKKWGFYDKGKDAVKKEADKAKDFAKDLKDKAKKAAEAKRIEEERKAAEAKRIEE